MYNIVLDINVDRLIIINGEPDPFDIYIFQRLDCFTQRLIFW